MTVSFTAEPQADGQSYAWSFPGGEPATSTDPNPSVVYNTPGSYDVSLSITNAAGTETTTETDYIIVGAGPNAAFTYANTVGEGEVVFTSASSDATSYSWDFGDSNSSDVANPTHTYAAEGTYTVVLTTTNACGSNSTQQEVTIVFPPTVSIVVSENEGCAPLTVTYTADPERDDYTYAWAFPGGEPATATTSTVMVTYATTGSYTASVTATNAAGSTSTTLANPVVVSSRPTASFTTDYTVGELTATFTATATHVPDEDSPYQWDFGDGMTGSGQTTSHTYDTAGTYTVSLTVTGPCGSLTITDELTVIVPPQGGFTASTTSGCEPLSVTFSPVDQGSGYTYQWSFPGGNPAISTEIDPSVIYENAGTYTVGLTVTNAAGSVTTMEEDYISVAASPTAAFISNNEVGALEVDFIATPGNASSWEWDFGDGNTASGRMASHTYATDGEYRVRLISSNACGADTTFRTISLLLPPEAVIVASTTTVCVDEVFDLQAQPTGLGYTYTWVLTGANPAMSTNANVQLSYPTAGSYTVELTVSNAAGSSTTSETIRVNPAPTASFSFTTNGLNASFTSTSTDADAHSWNFADLGTSTEENPTFSFPGTGAYPVTLTVENDCGTDTFVATVNIDGQVPTVSFEVANNSGCAPLEVSFTNTTLGGDNWAWSFPGGEPAVSALENPTVTYSTPGTYTVTLIATNAFGSSSLSRENIVTVLDNTQAAMSYELDVTTATFTDNSTAATQVEWQFPDGSTSTESNPTYTFPGNGIYTVSLIATGPCNTDTSSQEIIIDGPLPEVMISRDVEKGCVPLTVQFTDNSTGTPLSWAWSFPGGEPATSDAANPTVVYTTPGIYDVGLSVRNAYGSSSEVWTEYIEVDDVPGVTDIQQATFDGLTYGFNTTPSDPAWDYLWTFPDSSTQTSREAIYTFASSGIYTVSVDVSNNCGTVTLVDTVMIIVDNVVAPEWSRQLELYPNPTAGDLQIRATGWPAAGVLEVRLFNALGQELQSQMLKLASGSWQHFLDLHNLPAGTYQLQFLWEGRWWTAKISKI
ncbi:MAG: PKD domain-containing protein [Bacteroidetes bacterium]|nr:MAG: PKD domain-containing protein [Bacteroidota bacterium]